MRRETVANREDSVAAVSAHGLVLERVAARDPVGARAAMAAHLEHALQEWVRLGRPVWAVPETQLA